jgi:hypothetical protein
MQLAVVDRAGAVPIKQVEECFHIRRTKRRRRALPAFRRHAHVTSQSRHRALLRTIVRCGRCGRCGRHRLIGCGAWRDEAEDSLKLLSAHLWGRDQTPW